MPPSPAAASSHDVAARALARLTSEDDPALAQWVGLLIDHLLDQPAAALLPGQALAISLATAIQHLAVGPDPLTDPARQWLQRQTDDPRSLRERLPDGLPQVAEPLLQVPWTPSEAMVLNLLRHDAARDLVRETLAETLQAFATRARSLDDGVLKGIGGRALQKSRGWLGQVGSAAEGLVGAVSREVEQALEARIKEFLQGATDEALRSIARWMADPRHAPALAQMRVSAWHQLIDAPPASLMGSHPDVDPVDALAQAVRDGLQQLASRPALTDDLASLLEEARGALSDVRLRDWLPDDTAPLLHDTLQAAFLPAFREVTRSEDFANWWMELHA